MTLQEQDKAPLILTLCFLCEATQTQCSPLGNESLGISYCSLGLWLCLQETSVSIINTFPALDEFTVNIFNREEQSVFQLFLCTNVFGDVFLGRLVELTIISENGRVFMESSRRCIILGTTVALDFLNPQLIGTDTKCVFLFDHWVVLLCLMACAQQD